MKQNNTGVPVVYKCSRTATGGYMYMWPRVCNFYRTVAVVTRGGVQFNDVHGRQTGQRMVEQRQDHVFTAVHSADDRDHGFGEFFFHLPGFHGIKSTGSGIHGIGVGVGTEACLFGTGTTAGGTGTFFGRHDVLDGV